MIHAGARWGSGLYFGGENRARRQWQPTLDTHDPNPPIVLQDPAGGASNISFSDTGTGADAFSVAVAIDFADSGSGADALAVAVAAALSDSGSGADAVDVAVAVPLADAGAWTEALSVAVDVQLSDAGAGADALSVAASVGLEDAAAGADTLGIAASFELAESAAGSDSIALAVDVGHADAAACVDGLGVGADCPLSDAATGVDSLSVDTGATPVSLADAGAGADALSVQIEEPPAGSSRKRWRRAQPQQQEPASVVLADHASAIDTLVVARWSRPAERILEAPVRPPAVALPLAPELEALALIDWATGEDAIAVERAGWGTELRARVLASLALLDS